MTRIAAAWRAFARWMTAAHASPARPTMVFGLVVDKGAHQSSHSRFQGQTGEMTKGGAEARWRAAMASRPVVFLR
jgi:hypothetical protein